MDISFWLVSYPGVLVVPKQIYPVFVHEYQNLLNGYWKMLFNFKQENIQKQEIYINRKRINKCDKKNVKKDTRLKMTKTIVIVKENELFNKIISKIML